MNSDDLRSEQLLRDGPLFCMHPDCIAFRTDNPDFARRLQEAGIIAHYNGTDPDERRNWSLDGVTPINERDLTALLRTREGSL